MLNETHPHQCYKSVQHNTSSLYDDCFCCVFSMVHRVTVELTIDHRYQLHCCHWHTHHVVVSYSRISLCCCIKVVPSAVIASNIHRKSDVVQISIKHSAKTRYVNITQQSDPPLVHSSQNLSVLNKSNNNQTTTTAATDKLKGSSSGS
jgi:hypothetical protein